MSRIVEIAMATWRHLLEPVKPFGCTVYSDSLYTILGIPLENTVTHRPGTRYAPDSIREASCYIEFNSLYTGIDVDDVGFLDLGNISIVIGDNKHSLERIESVVEGFLIDYPRKTLIVLGGEHTLSYGVIAGILKRLGDSSRVTYIVFDAHLDLRRDYLGYSYSHACTQYLIHRDFGIKPVIIGARSWCREEIEYAVKHGIKVYTVLDTWSKPMDIISYIRETLEHSDKVYISIDMDVFDPAYAPGVSNPEALGIDTKTFFTLLTGIVEAIADKNNSIAAVDIVETNPLVDVNNVTSVLAARIVIEVTALLHTRLHGQA